MKLKIERKEKKAIKKINELTLQNERYCKILNTLKQRGVNIEEYCSHLKF